MDDAVEAVERPAWSRRTPDYELCYEEIIRSGAPPLSALMGTARLMHAEEVALLRIDFEPTLLYRVLEEKGFLAYTEPCEEGFRVYIRRKGALR